MTLRQMMRRVVTDPHGTAHRLHLVGYSLAGKTGTAQIFDAVHHAYTHKYNASFLGFAPMNNPSILIVSTVSGTSGEAGMGAGASGPAVQSVAEVALRIREVPRDIPEEVEALEEKELAAKNKLKKSEPAVETDTVAALSTPLTDEEAREAVGGVPDSEDQPIAVSAVSGPRIPDFTGKSVKDVAQEATAAGLDVEMRGDGVARAQYPLPGSPLEPGAHVRVRFAR
jgi:membrane peptidoglycan carboxypeptidase